ncbi:MAG: Uma2 family endonuclease [bacterium]|nr:Uma2 family endonuclease [bacterium]
MALQPKIKITPEEYLAAERQADFKSEYFDGEVFAMAGASYAHNLIVANVIAELRGQLKHQPCTVVPSDLRLWIETARHYLYPDVTVVCGEAAFTADRRQPTRRASPSPRRPRSHAGVFGGGARRG